MQHSAVELQNLKDIVKMIESWHIVHEHIVLVKEVIGGATALTWWGSITQYLTTKVHHPSLQQFAARHELYGL